MLTALLEHRLEPIGPPGHDADGRAAGGEGGRAHALDEWIDVEKTKSLSGAAVGLGILLATAGVP